MIQLKETDLMWKAYKRYYKDQQCLHPKSLCNLFWKSVGGMFKYAFWDTLVFLTAPVLGLATWGSLELKNCVPNGEWLAVPVAFLAFGATITSLMFVLCRGMEWACRTNREWLIPTALVVLMVGFMSVVFGLIYGSPFTVWNFVYGFLTLAGFAALFCLGMYLYDKYNDPTSQTGSIIKTYFFAVKDRVCPRVLIPGETNPQVTQDEIRTDGERVGGES